MKNTELKGKDEIKELFSEKLGGYEANVRPELWANISSQVAASSSVATTGLSMLSKTLIGLGIVAATVAGIVLITINSSVDKEQKAQTSDNIKVESIIEENIESTTADEINVPSVNEEVSPTDFNNSEEPESRLPLSIEEDNLRVEDDPLQEVQIDRTVTENETNLTVTTEEDKTTTESTSEDDHTIVVTEDESDKTTTEDDHTITEQIQLVLPNVCTPNNDGDNDEYFILDGKEGLSDFSAFIYNTRGEIVFRSNDPNFKWNGTGLDNQQVKEGTYMCVIIAVHESGQSIKESKQFRVVR